MIFRFSRVRSHKIRRRCVSKAREYVFPWILRFLLVSVSKTIKRWNIISFNNRFFYYEILADRSGGRVKLRLGALPEHAFRLVARFVTEKLMVVMDKVVSIYTCYVLRRWRRCGCKYCVKFSICQRLKWNVGRESILRVCLLVEREKKKAMMNFSFKITNLGDSQLIHGTLCAKLRTVVREMWNVLRSTYSASGLSAKISPLLRGHLNALIR